ncbi:MAG: serine/threonine-protein kinase [Gemmatimonadetes bacterium]|nr:serine/threonine-protein kinase [Gemmatimonadota bacterium]
MDESRITQSDAELRSHVERVLAPTYELDKEIGRGGMGIVFLARDARLKRNVAIKLLPPELSFRSEIRTRFLREAETAAQLSHPNIVPIYAVDEKQGLVYFVMAFIDGDNLAKRIHDSGPVEPTEARRIFRDVADALSYAHERGVVHRDIKPDNILLDKESGRPMVTDFGIARAITDGADARLTATGIAIGTPAFMSPEQSAGDRELDGRSDLYALGVVAYQMLCGDLPFMANNTPALLVKHLSEAPVPIDRRSGNVPADLARAVMLCLEKSPDDRFANARELVQALDSGDVPALPAPRPPRAPAVMDERFSAAAAGGDRGGRLGAARAPALFTHEHEFVPVTADELARWEDPVVKKFRSSVVPFLFVTAFFFMMSVVGGPNMLFVSAFWGINIAYRYARLWSDGYDWHDVFQVPHERLLWDSISEWFEHNIQSIWSKDKRVAARARRRQELSSGPGHTGARGPVRVNASDAAALGSGPHAALARQAIIDRDEIMRLIESLPRREKSHVTDVPATAQKLADSVMAIAAKLADLERSGGSAQSATAIDTEIKVLEGQANPLDRAASETRVRRLALLRRQRRGVAELARKREDLSGKLDNCALLLQNMKYDVLRLKTGDESWQHVTTIAEQAMAVAREVDSAVYVADELRRLVPRGSSIGRAPSLRNP